MAAVNVLLISTYELGRQPFGLASPAAWLRAEGAEVSCLDLSQQDLSEAQVRAADLIAFYLPMHTATRLAFAVIQRVRALKPNAQVCAYGLYAPLNADLLRQAGVGAIFGGEFEPALTETVRALTHDGRKLPPQSRPDISLDRLQFRVPDRTGLPGLCQYARLVLPDGSLRTVGYTEASRGCKHLCRHCPIVPVYQGRFRIVQRDIVLEDIRRQVAAGAEHITFGDPDFFNGITHALELVRALHREFPRLTYDVTIKVEHLLRHVADLHFLRDTGCAFVTSAVESLDDRVLALLDKGHTRDDFFRVVELFRHTGLTLAPTFVAFTPWIALEGYAEFLETISDLNLIANLSSVQLAIRLLIPAGSRLLELSEVQKIIGPFDQAALSYRWGHPDPRVDALQREIQSRVQTLTAVGHGRRSIFENVRRLTAEFTGAAEPSRLPLTPATPSRATVPYLTEPWYC
ncbi:MAG: radical SAM protein [Acidobacteriia bacterium]|nr:radical SAM protein [Terriglobia bacterium]